MSHMQNSFDALEHYILSQKALLARTQSDVDCVGLMRDQVATNPEYLF